MTARAERRRGRTRLSSKRQVTIPIEVVEEAGLKVGDELRVEIDGHRRIVLVREADPITEFAGGLTGIWPEGWLEELRDEWER